jgi:ABC-type nitrate/sulfonate/bicarbonate transport system substrate-binding protein
VDKIRVATANRGAGTAPVFATVEGGFFGDEGLEVELVPHDGHPRSLRALLAGEADFTNAVAAELIRANATHRGDAVIIASAISRSAQQVSARPGLHRREDLRGRRWGVQWRGDADECSIVMAFDRWGWDPARDAEIVVVGGDGPRLDLLLDPARVDVAIMHAPEPFQAARRGWTLVEDLGRLDVAWQNSCAATTRRLLASRPDLALRYVRAYCRGVHRFRTDAAFGQAVLRRYTGEHDRGVLEATYVLFARLMGAMMYPSLEGVRAAATMLHRLGVIDHPPAAEDVVDLGLVARLEEAGLFSRLLGVGDAGRGKETA